MIFYDCTWHKAKAIDRSCRPQANLHPSSLARLALIVFMCTEDQNASDWSSERSSSRLHVSHVSHVSHGTERSLYPFLLRNKDGITHREYPRDGFPMDLGAHRPISAALSAATRPDSTVTRPWLIPGMARSFGGPHCVSKRVSKHQLINDVEW